MIVSNLLTTLVLLNQVILLISSTFLHSDERLQSAVGSSCALRKLYNEHKETHLQEHTRPPSNEKDRLNLFLKEIKAILELRANTEIKWKVGLNFMADFTEKEHDSLKGTGKNTSISDKNIQSYFEKNAKRSVFTAPEEFDEWRNNGMIGKVHNQKKGSCWAHAAVVPLEAQLAFYKGKLQRLSVEELYNCVYVGKVPNGGYPREAFDYVQASGRLGTWEESKETYEFPIPIFKTKCKGYDKKANALEGYHITSNSWVASPQVLEEKLVCVGPVTISMGGYALTKHYKSGIFTVLKDKWCEKIDHSMAIVGYNKDAYIIRNSWGTSWGEEGYLYFNRKGPFCSYFQDEDVRAAKLQDKNEEFGRTPCRWPQA